MLFFGRRRTADRDRGKLPAGGMLLSRAEMTFDFGGARLDPVRDRQVLGWVLNQFLYGEVAANQIGEWLFEAPNIEAARFLARQAVEELQHVDSFLAIMAMLGVEPARAHRFVRFLVTGMKGTTWPEHVALVMAAGEGLVLMCLYGLIDTLDHPQAVQILERAVRQEERHVDFGEQETMRVVQGRPGLRRRLLGLSLVSLWAVRRLAAAMERRMPPDSPVVSRLAAFTRLAAASHELRLQRMGLLDRPQAQLPAWRQGLLVAEAYLGKAAFAFVSFTVLRPLRWLGILRRRRLTETYLADPVLRAAVASRGGTGTAGH
jgi:hypothetical protein